MKPNENKNDKDLFSQQVAKKEKRKLKASKQNKDSVWFGLGMMGMIGWSVTIPALLGAAAGIWMDKKYPQSFSWTLTLLITGLMTGSVIAWHWVDKEDKEIHQDKTEDDE